MDMIDKKILSALENGMPLTDKPFRVVAESIGIDEMELITRIRNMKSLGIIRRFGASINQHKLGIKANAVIAWRVPNEKVEEVAKAMSSANGFSHCYERETIPGVWEYNIFTVIHSQDRETATDFIAAFSQKIGIDDYRIFFSTRGFKGSSAESRKKVSA